MFAFVSFGARAQGRLALVIGNAAYVHSAVLSNPGNDARDMAGALKKLDFKVIEGLDLDKAGMERKVREFAEAFPGAEAAVFYYSGHGLQVAGVNYLVPVDAKLSSAAALDFEMVRLDLIQRTMERETQTNILFLDACRDNPLSKTLARAMGTRSQAVGQGLAPAESGVGSLISFATQPGNVAFDGVGRNSPFTGPLVKLIGVQGQDILSALTEVRKAVLNETGGKQVPWENHALLSKFYFNSAPAPGTAPLSSEALRTQEAERAWRTIKDSERIAEIEPFARRYGDTLYGEVANKRLAALQAAENAKKPAVPSRRIWFGPGPGPGSELVLLNNGTWVEFQAGAPQWTFRVLTDTAAELLLLDPSRDTYLRITFGDRQVYWRRGPVGPWNTFFPINKLVDDRPSTARTSKKRSAP